MRNFQKGIISTNRIKKWLPWVVLGGAGSVRFFYLWTFWADHPFSQVLISDARIFDDWALRIAGGDWLGAPEVFVLPPLYPYLVGLLYALVGHMPKLVVVLQALSGCLTGVLVYDLGRRHFGEWVGLIGGLLFSAYGPQLFFEGMLLGNSGAVFLCILGVCLIDRACERGRERGAYWAVAGLVFGLAALMRPNALSAIPFLILGVWWLKRDVWSVRMFAKASGRFVGFLMLPLLLCGLRNGWVAGDWVLITAHGGINFYMGNHADAPGWFSSPEGMDAEITPEGVKGNLEGPRRVAEAALGRSLKASEVSAFWSGKAWGFMLGDPVGALRVWVRKVRLFLSGYETPLNYNFYYHRQAAGMLRFPAAELWFVFPLAFLGLGAAALRGRRHALLYLWIVGYAAGVIAFHVSSRYRTPVVPVVMMFAAFGIWTLVMWARTQSWTRFGMAMVALTVLWMGYRADLDGWLAQSDLGLDPFNLGTSYLWAGKSERALAFLKEAETYGHRNAALYYNMGLAYGRIGQSDAAKRAYREALLHNPKMARAHANLGNLLFREGAYREALDAYLDALAIDAGAHNARANLGWAYWSLGRPVDAQREWQAVLRAVPDHPSAGAGMARLKAQQER